MTTFIINPRLAKFVGFSVSTDSDKIALVANTPDLLRF
jgi:hypothetical protein